jgi:hypothetical protein
MAEGWSRRSRAINAAAKFQQYFFSRASFILILHY